MGKSTGDNNEQQTQGNNEVRQGMCLHDNITRPKNTQQSPLNPHNKTQKPQAPARMVRGINVDEQET